MNVQSGKYERKYVIAEEIINDLYDKYGDDFSWRMVSLTDETFVGELRKEIGKDHILYDRNLLAIAKCDSRDDVLYLADEGGTCSYYIFHLTYSGHNMNDFPKCKRFINMNAVKEYIEQVYAAEYL